MEPLVSGLLLGALGYIIQELKALRKCFNNLENRLIVLETKLPKRKGDHVDNAD